MVEPENAGHHPLHLDLVGLAIAGHGHLGFGGCVQGHGNPPLRRSQHGQPCRLGGSQHGVVIGLGEDPLDGYHIGAETVQGSRQSLVDGQQAQVLALFGV